ncbi:MAG: hypothetical protein NTV21_04850 [Planctomycetota bacterium]|nr:hypothetical protein [Planctomycetota bacterium]
MRTPLLAGLLLATSTSLVSARQAQLVPFDQLTNTYRSATNFNVETVRGLDVSASGRTLMINTHGSRIVQWTGGPATGSPPVLPTISFPTVHNPIALETFLDTSVVPNREYAVVLGAGTHALVLHDLTTMRITNCETLPAEPGDVVVDDVGRRAFVSIPGNNTVRQYALPSLQLEAVFTVASQRPRFLYLEPTGGPDGIAMVYVTPELSGNGTGTMAAVQQMTPSPSGPLAAEVAHVMDFHTLDAAGLLPDEDLFRIKPHTPSGGVPGQLAAVPVLRNLGTLLMAHGKHPSGSSYWTIGVESLNASQNTEPAINGKFAKNVLTISAWPPPSGPLPFTHTVRDLDLGPASTYAAPFSVSFPYALEFHPLGFAAIAGSASDQVRIVDALGKRLGDLELPVGSIPRDLALGFGSTALYVYCWGTNEVRIYDIGALITAIAGAAQNIVPPSTAFIGSLNLGADPQPPEVKAGRQIFYDADNSANGRVTCNHCHPGGGMDLLGWEIQDFPHDHKDLMVTQSLKSIEDTFPYHWRGERDLEAFNGAFAGLLGGSLLSTTPDGGDLDKFKSFVFSLQAHANPNEHESRNLDNTASHPGESFAPTTVSTIGSASKGLALMTAPKTLLGRFSCAECHTKPSGTVGDPQFDDISPLTTNSILDVAHLRQLFHKQQDLVTFTFGGTQFRTLRGGFGLSHDGDNASVLDFLRRAGFTLTQSEQLHLAEFIAQFDQGIAPAAHHAYRISSSTTPSEATRIGNLMLGQAGATFSTSHWISLAIIGSHRDQGNTLRDLTWLFVPAAGTFLASDPTVVFPNGSVGTQTWADLTAQAALGKADFTLIGLPPGNSIRFAFDRDDDGLFDRDELLRNPQTNPDRFSSDTDQFPDGYEVLLGGMNPLVADAPVADNTPPSLLFSRVDHAGATFAKLVLQLSEPAKLEITSTNPLTGHSVVEHRRTFRAFDTVTVQRLQGSLPTIVFSTMAGYPLPSVVGIPFTYNVSVKMTDFANNFATQSLSTSVTTGNQLVFLPYFEIPSAWNDPSGGRLPAGLGRTVENLAWLVTPATSLTAKVTAQTKIRFPVPQVLSLYANPSSLLRPNGSTSPDENQIVVAQVLGFDPVTQAWSVLTTTPSGGALGIVAGPDVHPKFGFEDVSHVSVNSPIAGPFVFSSTSNAAGNVQLSFTLNRALLPGEKVKVNIIGVYEHNLRAVPPQAVEYFWSGSKISWNMPMTAERNRGIQFP